jgi:hypothetical protein
MKTPCVVSVADHAGWSHLVCVAAPAGVPAVVERRKVMTIDPGLPTMPYHHESLGLAVSEADALIARVRQSIDACTSRALREVVADLKSAYDVRALAIRTPTFPALPDSVATVRQSYPLQCAADGMMYQAAWCRAAGDSGLNLALCPRGGEVSRTASRFDMPPGDVEAFIRGRGRPAGPPWTEEHRRAYAAAIAVLAGLTRVEKPPW